MPCSKLNFRLYATGELCQFLILSLAVAASAPGLAAVGCTPSTLGLLLCVHALVFARCEDALHAEAHEDGEPMYPPYLVFITSAAGMTLAGKLEAGVGVHVEIETRSTRDGLERRMLSSRMFKAR